MDKSRKTIVVISPVYNEENSISLFVSELDKVVSGTHDIDFSAILVNDGSEDGTWQCIEALCQKYSFLKAIDLSRNFGKERALTAGLDHHNDADAVIFIDSDLQHPPKLIPEFISRWQEGHEVVIGVRNTATTTNMFRKYFGGIYYAFVRKFSEISPIPNSTDFRLLDQSVVEAIRQIGEKDRIFRGIVDWVGFNRTFVFFDVDERSKGQTKFSAFKLIDLALSSITSLTTAPLKFTFILGVLNLVIGLSMFFVMMVDKLFFDFLNASPAAFVLVLTFSNLGLILLVLGVISLYLSKIATEVAGKPIYIIRRKIL
ncbi:glycosyltransferase family 2 protein [Candidatus Puniceispirillum marinum]|uniref:Glycosyltransferase 2-like domain-containing protein n=1 Tax=Puniceispirillum marinum (strain IMCC1322) TaxID=488538 RepID=D5BSI9_PUNMI|nr:glycosyltransferase family 2 protein [Candidatus Puniceispirillum marinum]ADE39236.1 hypothetical protein SAR116_0993 [Candidatus Puniceispirillum marinum IMCC1322]